MEVLAVSSLLFILFNLCLGIVEFTQLVISNEANAALRDSWLWDHFHDLVNTRYSLIAALVAETLGLLILLLLLWWVVHRFSVSDRHRLLPIRHYPTTITASALFYDNSNTNRSEIMARVFPGSRHLQRLAQILENYGIRFRQQLIPNPEDESVGLHHLSRSRVEKPARDPMQRAALDASTVTIRPTTTLESDVNEEFNSRDFEVEGGVEYATCQWKDPEGFDSDESNAGSSQPARLRATEIYVVQTLQSRRWSASYTHAIQLLCGYALVFLILMIPHYILLIALKVLKQNLPVSFVRLSRSQTATYLADWANRTSTDQDAWQFVRESFACHTEGDQNACFTSLDQSEWTSLDQVRRCAASIQSASAGDHTRLYCGLAMHQWVEQKEWHSTIRIALFIITYATCVSFIVRAVAWPTTSTSCQTYPRTNWWKGTGHRGESLPKAVTGRSRLFDQSV